MRNHRVTILNKVQPSERQFGEKTGYRRDGSLWSSYEFSKGTKALREGALDAYDSVIFRMNFSANVTITRESLIECDGKVYQVQSLNSDKRENKIIIRATEMTTQVNIIPEPTPEPEPTPTPTPEPEPTPDPEPTPEPTENESE